MSVKQIEQIADRNNLQGSGAVKSASRSTDGFHDRSGINPRPEYVGKATTTSAVISGGKTLNTFGADIPEDTVEGEEAQYGMNYSYQTPAGHTIEYNDTPASERIMIRHKSGTGINIGPDGSVMISSKRRVDVVNENHYLSVAGNGVMSYEGNLTLNVTGDFNVNVGGEYNVTSTKQNVTTNGNSTRTVYGDDNHTIRGNSSALTTGGAAHTYLEGLNTIVKGDNRYAVEGNMTMATSQTLTMTSDREVVITSKEANIAADNLSVFGDTGTIGGDNIIMYNQNMYTDEHIQAKHITATARVTTPVTYGDLQGTATQAITADVTNSQNYADTDPGGDVGSAQGFTAATDTSEIDTTATAKATASLMEDYRTKGSKGVRQVKIDPNNLIKDSIDLSTKTGGVTNRPLTKEEVRAKMREPNNRSKQEFIAKALSDGLLSPEHTKSSPPNIASIKSTSSITIQGQTPIGSVDLHRTAKRLKGL